MKNENALIEQYKLYIQTAEKVSDRRQSANNYFLIVNSLLLSFTGYLTTLSFSLWHIVISIAGISISFLWLLTLRSFRSLNTAKFKVIHELERELPVDLFKREWDYLEQYLKLSVVEQGVPIIFLILYVFIIILMLMG